MFCSNLENKNKSWSTRTIQTESFPLTLLTQVMKKKEKKRQVFKTQHCLCHHCRCGCCLNYKDVWKCLTLKPTWHLVSRSGACSLLQKYLWFCTHKSRYSESLFICHFKYTASCENLEFTSRFGVHSHAQTNHDTRQTHTQKSSRTAFLFPQQEPAMFSPCALLFSSIV